MRSECAVVISMYYAKRISGFYIVGSVCADFIHVLDFINIF